MITGVTLNWRKLNWANILASTREKGYYYKSSKQMCPSPSKARPPGTCRTNELVEKLDSPTTYLLLATTGVALIRNSSQTVANNVCLVVISMRLKHKTNLHRQPCSIQSSKLSKDPLKLYQPICRFEKIKSLKLIKFSTYVFCPFILHSFD